jgi:hypothetical protein
MERQNATGARGIEHALQITKCQEEMRTGSVRLQARSRVALRKNCVDSWLMARPGAGEDQGELIS